MFRIVDFVHKIGILHAIAVLVLLAASTTVLINRSGSIVTLIAGSAASLGDDTVLYFTPHGSSTLKIGDTTDVDVRINSKTPINTVGATIKFPQDSLEVVGISKEDSFLTLWTEDTSIREKEGEVHFSGGTVQAGGLSGIGTIVTLTLKAKKAGPAQLYIKDAQIFAADGRGSEVPSNKRIFTLDIPGSASSIAAAGSGGGSNGKMNEVTFDTQSIDFNNDGKVNVVDLSIIAIQLIAPYSAKYDLNHDGVVNLGDLSIFFTRLRQ